MKKLSRIIAYVLVIASILTCGAFAATPKGLSAFEDIADMSTTTFSDLVSNHWAFSGIKICYDRGILIGYPDGTFGPEESVTWSHAVTIAARIHSTYYGKSLNTNVSASDDWYKPYYTYCKNNSLLPSACPKLSELDNKSISRNCLAYMFSRVISASDMPAISDQTITDLDSIPSYYRSSVKKMYAAGIMNGMEGNEFKGGESATRAQVATVVSRLIIPSERLGYDGKANLEMQPYEANLENDSVAVQLGNSFYCINKYYTDPSTEVYALYLTDGNSVIRELYTCESGDYLNNISVYKGKVYFCKCASGTADGSLLCYNPANEKVSVVYSGNIVEGYCFYDGNIYALLYTNYSKKTDEWRYDFGVISNGSFNAIKTGYTYNQARYFQPYGWNGKIYFKLGIYDAAKGQFVTNLYAYNIDNEGINKVLDVDINTSFFDGHVMYFLAYDADGNYDCNLYAVSVQCPNLVYSVGEFPTGTDTKFRTLYKFGDEFLCLASFNRNIYSMDKAGNTRMALACGGVYSSLCFTEDKAILIPNTLTTSNPNEIKIYSASTLGARSLYSDWMGLSCYYEGAHFTIDEGQDIYSTDESVSTVSKLPITITEAFMRGDDLVIRAKYQNNTDTDIKLRSYIVSVAANGRTVAYDVNRMWGYELKNYGIQTFTFVIGKDDISSAFDIASDSISIQIMPTYDIIETTTETETTT